MCGCNIYPPPCPPFPPAGSSWWKKQRCIFRGQVGHIPQFLGNNRREERDRRAHKGSALFSVPFAGMYSHNPFPLHHVRDCKQANNNRAVKPRARRYAPPCAAEGNCSARSSGLQNICFFIDRLNNTSHFSSPREGGGKKREGFMRGERRRNYLWQASFTDRRGTISHIYGPPSYHRRRISFSEWYANCCGCHFSFQIEAMSHPVGSTGHY